MILVDGRWKHTYGNAVGRWAGIGPYYAMFPKEFAFDIIHSFTDANDWILDPFAGRFSSIYAAVTQARNGLGIEINPVGWVYGKSKIQPAPKTEVEQRLREVCKRARYFGTRSHRKLPEFFLHCYSPSVLSFLIAARDDLNWEEEPADRTLMALILVFLHAKKGSGLSSQMRQSKAMAPDYSIRWWKEHNEKPPDIDPLDFFQEKIHWRYQNGLPKSIGRGIVRLADSTCELQRVVEEVSENTLPKFRLLFTSPPYHDLTHYHYDQWLRVWMLGGPNWPSKTEDKHRGRFSSRVAYVELLDKVFGEASKLMSDDAIVYVRTDQRTFTREATRGVLSRHFPGWTMRELGRPVERKTQTSLFGDRTEKPGEVDLILMSSASRYRDRVSRLT